MKPDKVMKTKRLRIIFTGACLGWLAPLSSLPQPVITTQPTDHFLNTPAAVTFSVTAAGTAPLAYQWLFDGKPIPGANGWTLSVPSPTPDQWGYYSVIVTNASGAVTSRLAELKVFVPALHGLSGIQAQPDGSMALTFAGETTASFAPYYDLYPLEGSSNLVNWALVGTLQRANTALDTLRFMDTNASEFSQRFYRTPTNALPTPASSPTGPYAIGTFSMLLTDPSRTNTVRRTNHQFMITFWYPAVAQAGVLPAAYVERQVALSSVSLYERAPSHFGSRAAAFCSHSLSNAPVAPNPARFPVVLYCPGGGDHRRDNTDRVEELASWGYVAVGLDSSNTFLSVFPDGTLVVGRLDASTVEQIVAAIEDWLRDQQFVLDELERLNAEDPRLGGRLDLDKVGAFGWSLGGAAAAQLCLRDLRCKAGAGMDGTFFETNIRMQTLSVPYLFLRAGNAPDPENVNDDRWLVYSHFVTNAYWVKVSGTVHGSFADPGLIFDSASMNALWGTPTSGQFLAPARVSHIVRAYLLSFFNKHLRGEEDHLLDAPSADFPEVMQFLRK